MTKQVLYTPRVGDRHNCMDARAMRYAIALFEYATELTMLAWSVTCCQHRILAGWWSVHVV